MKTHLFDINNQRSHLWCWSLFPLLVWGSLVEQHLSICCLQTRCCCLQQHISGTKTQNLLFRLRHNQPQSNDRQRRLQASVMLHNLLQLLALFWMSFLILFRLSERRGWVTGTMSLDCISTFTFNNNKSASLFSASSVDPWTLFDTELCNLIIRSLKYAHDKQSYSSLLSTFLSVLSCLSVLCLCSCHAGSSADHMWHCLVLTLSNRRVDDRRSLKQENFSVYLRCVSSLQRDEHVWGLRRWGAQ